MNEQNRAAPAAPQTAAPKPELKMFHTIDGNSLMTQKYEPLPFAIEKILPHGVFVFSGSPKVGKSWLTLDMCQAISRGGKLWDFPTTQGEVLYLALEDKYSRLQGRLIQMAGRGAKDAPLLAQATRKAAALDISRLHLATASFGMSNGLLKPSITLSPPILKRIL